MNILTYYCHKLWCLGVESDLSFASANFVLEKVHNETKNLFISSSSDIVQQFCLNTIEK